MKYFTFPKGIHPPHRKNLTSDKPIQSYLPKDKLIFPMKQHIGAPCNPTVNIGDYIKVGDIIGNSTSFISSPIISSVSGTIKDIKKLKLHNDEEILSIIVCNDSKYLSSSSIKRNFEKLNNNEILKIIKTHGIVGLGGACFPTYIKLTPPKDVKIDSIIINGAECEPYLTCDYRLMIEKTNEIFIGIKILLKLFPNAKVYIAIENNKPLAIKEFLKLTKSISNIKVVPLKSKYPQGSEKHIIYACTKRKVPSGKLPSHIGCIVQNIATVYQIYESIINDKPLIEKIITVTGDAISHPKNLKVKIGTNIKELINECNGFKKTPEKIILGGPMMGISISSLDIPVTKGTSGIICLSEDSSTFHKKSNCIRCGNCLKVCPMNLLCQRLHKLSKEENLKEFERLHGMDCIECGSCTYICPAKNLLIQDIKNTKQKIIKNKTLLKKEG
ncbi:electron transport complex subunit RsxC [Clostridium tarantellae]|uniref:Ion-translocating oxidoreductase complex subunit C n=1 Tax=Clostridium tarantellae TaxID=39493 RepID=A0A6I1MIM2_9CLOT|nr:electron transport complex subunit RsxC [Clostridium tarantellae]MPQ43396.1 electron transport complex subunit RsxC [Clostridium tarantellae]